ncbi:MAG: hypothetical protein K6A41_06820 [Bacteroidales bacterium]|nr:hypothetical protein [Bacteroidales bacterium]
MIRLILFSKPITLNGETFCGRLYAGCKSECEIKTAAKKDYKELLLTESWNGEQGKQFREKEGWKLQVDETEDIEWWKYDESKYTFDYFSDILEMPDQFAEEIVIDHESVAMVSTWVPLRFAVLHNDGYLLNVWSYNTIAGSPEIRGKDTVWPT